MIGKPVRPPSLRDGAIPLCVIVALVVALFYNGLHTDYYAIAGITLCLALALAVLNSSATDVAAIGLAGCLLLLLFGWTLVAVSWSSIPYLTSIEAGTIGCAVGAYCCFRLFADHDGVKRMLAMGLVLVGLILASVMIWQGLSGERPEGPFLNVNTAGALLNLLWPIPAAAALHPAIGSKRRAGLVAMVAVMAFAVGIVGGRAVGLALIASVLIFALTGVRWRQSASTAVISLTILVALFVANQLRTFLPESGIRGLGHRLATLSDPTAAGASRLRIWDATWEMILEKPWLGWGPGTFYQAYSAYRPARDGSAGFHVHNDYLQFWVEAGVPALLILLLTVGVCTVLYLRALRPWPASPDQRTSILAASTALAGVGVHALFSYNLQVLPYLIVVGIALAALEGGSDARTSLTVPVRRIRERRLPTVALLLLLAIPVVHLGTVAASHRYVNEGLSLMASGQFQSADRALRTAARLWDAQDLAPGMRAQVRRRALDTLAEENVERRATLKREAEEQIAAALARNPLRAMHYITRGRVLAHSPDADPNAAADSFRRALEIDPRAASARELLARWLQETGRPEQALAVVNGGFGMHYVRVDPISLMKLGVELRSAAGDEDGADRLRHQISKRRRRAADLDGAAPVQKLRPADGYASSIDVP